MIVLNLSHFVLLSLLHTTPQGAIFQEHLSPPLELVKAGKTMKTCERVFCSPYLASYHTVCNCTERLSV